MDTQASRVSRPSLLLPSLIIFILAGCAAPGEPTERRPPTPQAVSDLAASQLGNSVELTFTLPDETLDHHPLAQEPTIEIFRDFSPATSGAATSGAAGSGAAGKAAVPAIPEPPSLLITIPSDAVDGYEERGRIRYTDSLKPEDFTEHPDSVATYIVRTRVSPKRDSANSNAAGLRFYPAPDPIDDLKGEFTHAGVTLGWSAPQQAPAGPAPPILRYSIYRSLSGGSSPTTASGASGDQKRTIQPVPPAAKIGESESTSYLDMQFESGSTYIYFVRSVVQYGTELLESGDSNLVTVTARDSFPPAVPQGIVVVPVPAQSGQPAYLDLSWAISPETDLAGYNVYRSEDVGVLGTRLNQALLPAPTFRDMNAVPGRRYFYSVTAVDHSRNESPPSAVVSGTVSAESQQTP
jgi:hypothetical protein